jgi:biopolymer transport protein ExbD
MKIKKPKVIKAYIPTASMADIAFLLIIFFMVSSVFPMDRQQVNLPETREVKQYREDSAVISITTENLAWVRQNRNRTIRALQGQTADRVVIKASNGKKESKSIYEHDSVSWDLSVVSQWQGLRDSIKNVLKDIELRKMQEGGRHITIVIKADAKVPFYAVDGVIEALQDLGGQTAQGVAFLSKQEES